MKIALVTGGSRGIGAAIVDRLARDGMKVFFNYLQDHDAADVRVEEVARAGGEAVALQRNLSDPDEVTELVESIVGAEGGIDVLVSNAASGVFRSVGEFTPKHWRWTFDVNARAFLLLTQAAAPSMARRGGGRVVALTSAGARRSIPLYTLVGASKAAVEALVRQFAVELAGQGIRVNAVSPGLVATEGVRLFVDDPTLKWVSEQTPCGRLVQPDDVAGLVSFLCREESGMLTGQTLTLDGGYGLIG